MAGAKVPLTFRIFKGDQLLREERLSLSVIKLGKVPSAHLKLDDETVSRMHAIIEVNGPNDVSIIDLGSTKGTFVNGQKVNKAKLQSGDTILVGETRIELAISHEEEADEPTRVNTAAAAPTGNDVVSSAPASRPAPPPAPSPMAATMAAPPPPRSAPSAPAAAPSPLPPASFAPPIAAPALRPPPGLPGGAGFGTPAPSFGTALGAPAGFQQHMAQSVEDPSARAVEVVAMLGDSVVHTKHCAARRDNPGMGRGLFWAGIAFLLLFGFSFIQGYRNASFNAEYRDYEINKLHKPVKALRLREVPRIYDFTMLLGLFGGIGLVGAGMALTKKRKKDRYSPDYRIGTTADSSGMGVSINGIPVGRFGEKDGVDFVTAQSPSPDFPLIASTGMDFAFNFTPGMEGEVTLGGQTQSLADLAAQGRTSIAPIPQDAKIKVKLGQVSFLVKPVNRGFNFNWGTSAFVWFLAIFGAVITGAALIMFAFWGLMRLVPVDDSSAGFDLAAIEETATRTNNTANDDPPPPEQEDKPDDNNSNESGGTGTKMALDEGKMGKKDSDRAEGQYKMQKTSDDPQLARQQAVEAARNAGILGSTALTQGGAFASLTGTGDISSGFDDSNIYGGLLGNEAGEMNGGFGYGRSGFGPGGGGTGWGTIGTGRYGTIGHGSGTGNGYGVGGGRGNGRGHQAAVPTVSIGTPNANGDLDKAIIRRYIKRNINKIQYCYEKALLSQQDLQGTVMVQFFISPNGTVANSSGSGINGEVAGCVAAVIKEIEFPKPKGGGGVQVNYPFDFRRSGS